MLFRLSVIYAEGRTQAHNAECHYAEWHYAECHGAFCKVHEHYNYLQLIQLIKKKTMYKYN